MSSTNHVVLISGLILDLILHVVFSLKRKLNRTSFKYRIQFLNEILVSPQIIIPTRIMVSPREAIARVTFEDAAVGRWQFVRTKNASVGARNCEFVAPAIAGERASA